ncbi:MAG: hypothetical protein HOV68_28945 [Streptomycetaceae bacterium]|nr:hypothetical protein [Streptomycetaceae bacterium]
MRFPEGFPTGGPREVEGGLKARSTRGAIGDTWWSKAFIGALESFADKGRLTRGRAYARKGQVLDLVVDAGVVRAQVQGSRDEPYAVTLVYPVIPEPVWERIEERLAAQARFAAHLLAGQVPHELSQVFYAEGTALFPTRAVEVDLECSCPDWGWPCKHVAAVCYLLAERFDDDPFALLRWRGREREALMARLRELRSGDPTPPPSASAPQFGTAAALGSGSGAASGGSESEVDLSRFWTSPEPLPDEPPAAPPDVPAARQIPPPPAVLGGTELAALMARVRAAG